MERIKFEAKTFPLTSCVILGKLLSFSDPPFLHCNLRRMILPTPSPTCEDEINTDYVQESGNKVWLDVNECTHPLCAANCARTRDGRRLLLSILM